MNNRKANWLRVKIEAMEKRIQEMESEEGGGETSLHMKETLAETTKTIWPCFFCRCRSKYEGGEVQLGPGKLF